MENPARSVLRRAVLPLGIAWLAVPATFLLPSVDSTTAPYFDLTATTAVMANAISRTATPLYASLLLGLLALLVVSRSGVAGRRRLAETVGMIAVVAGFAGGGAALNESVIKEALAVPRPNILALAGSDGAGPLRMTPEVFYESGDKRERSELLESVLSRRSVPIALDPSIKEHWIQESGYSLPSGHSFAAFFFATFFLFVGVSYLASGRLALIYGLLPWAVAVCYSRSILRVHTPTDITVGSAQGVALGVLAWLIARALVRRYEGRAVSL